ncbi:MAG: hypothetical protein V3U76_20005 [Granulosicoccus sp.]
MARTSIDIDDLCLIIMNQYQFATKRESVNLALQQIATGLLSLKEARKLRAPGWEGYLEEMRRVGYSYTCSTVAFALQEAID